MEFMQNGRFSLEGLVDRPRPSRLCYKEVGAALYLHLDLLKDNNVDSANSAQVPPRKIDGLSSSNIFVHRIKNRAAYLWHPASSFYGMLLILNAILK